MIIYKITCKINNKIYIGQTCETLQRRFKRHMGYQKDKNNTKFYRAVRRYGVKNFYIEEIDSANSQEELDEKELYWINKLNAVHNGYNSKSSKGKCGGDTLSNHQNKKQICEKLRVSKLGDNNPMRIYGGLKGSKNGFSRKCVAIPVINPAKVLIFDTITDCQKHFNIKSMTSIRRRCNGVTKSPYEGFNFMYYEDYIRGQETIESVSKKKNLRE